MSKKIAGGGDAIVLDVKTGSGAFMKTLDGARELARAMVGIGAQVTRRTIAVITDMDQPLGRAVGNALEVAEAIETLRGEGPVDLRDLCLELGAQMATLAGVTRTAREGKAAVAKLLRDGSALAKFGQMIEAQGGDRRVVDDLRRLPTAPVRVSVEALSSGAVAAIDALAVGVAAMELGAGRARRDDRIDPAVGIVLARKVGDAVRPGEPLADVHASDRMSAERAGRQIQAAYRIGARASAPRPLVHEVISLDGPAGFRPFPGGAVRAGREWEVHVCPAALPGHCDCLFRSLPGDDRRRRSRSPGLAGRVRAIPYDHRDAGAPPPADRGGQHRAAAGGQSDAAPDRQAGTGTSDRRAV